jgi:hypothetical protein
MNFQKRINKNTQNWEIAKCKNTKKQWLNGSSSIILAMKRWIKVKVMWEMKRQIEVRAKRTKNKIKVSQRKKIEDWFVKEYL